MFHRELKLVRTDSTRKDGDLVIGLALASDAPYERWWGIEVLDCSEQAVRAERLNDGASVLFNHEWDDLRGVHVPGSIRYEKAADLQVVRADVRIESVTQKGRDTIGLIEAEHLTKVSTGYRIHRVIEQTTSKTGERSERPLDGRAFDALVKRCDKEHPGDLTQFRRLLDARFGAIARAEDEPTVYRVVDWEPLETSLVTVPADAGVGIGRQSERTVAAETNYSAIAEVVNPAAPAASQEKATMAEVQAAAGAIADTEVRSISAVDAAKEHRQAIIDLCKSNNIDSRVEARWIAEGTPFSVVAKQILEVHEERGKNKPGGTIAELGLSSSETRRYSIFKAIRSLRFGGIDPKAREAAAFEIECSRAVAKNVPNASETSFYVPAEVLTRPIDPLAAQRTMTTIPGAKGGYLVSTENMGFIDILRNRSVVRNMGARVLSGLVGNVTIPRQTGKGSVTWQPGEAAAITPTDQALGQLSLTPRTAITVTNVSEQLLRQSSPSAEDFIMADLAAVVAIDGVDYTALKGTGGAQPIGIFNTPGISASHDLSSVNYAKVLGMPIAAGTANALLTNPGFVTSVAGSGKLMQTQRFSGTDTPLWDGNLLDGTCVGFRGLASNQLGSAEMLFGSWGELVIGEWGVLELSLDNGGTRFDNYTVGIRAVWMVDVLVRYPQAFVASVNLG